MKIYQFYKKLNATEAGKTDMNETYISIPKKTNLEEWFAAYGKEQPYIAAQSGKEYSLILRDLSREYRITGLGPFYRDHNVDPGDKLILEKRIDSNGNQSHIINISKSGAIFVLQLTRRYGFRILNGADSTILEENNGYGIYYQGRKGTIKLDFLINSPIRKDSKRSYDFYDININDKSIKDDFNHDDIIEIFLDGSTCLLINNPTYQKQIISY